MRKSYWSLLCSAGLLIAFSGAARESPGALCRAGRPTGVLTVYYEQRIVPPPAGTPLDEALLLQRAQADKITRDARLAFFTRPSPGFSALANGYTFLVPDSAHEAFGTGVIPGFGEISLALKYRRQLWRAYVEEFSSVRQAPAEKPDLLRLEVSLDLAYFCRYGQKTADLVTRDQ